MKCITAGSLRTRQWFPRALAAAALVITVGVMPAHAQTAPAIFGSLGNFDVYNDTGEDTEGYEIDLDGITATQVPYTFGGSYNRYGSPQLTDGVNGVTVRYAASYDALRGTWSTATPVPPEVRTTDGHTCYAFGDPAGYLTSGCEHFGVSVAGNPTATHMHWLVRDPANPGQLLRSAHEISIPVPTWTYYPPAVVGDPAQVQAEIQPPEREAAQPRGDAIWVKVLEKQMPRAVDLKELLFGEPAVPAGPAETEVEWELLQQDPAKPANGARQHRGKINAGDKAVVRRFELYKYSGAYDLLTHEALCAGPKLLPASGGGGGGGGSGGGGGDGGGGECLSPAPGELGDYIGAQMAADNLNQKLPVRPTLKVGKATGSTGSGTIVSDVGRISYPAVASDTYDAGATVTLSATPKKGTAFTGWTGACTNLDPICTVALAKASNSVKAMFVLLPKRLLTVTTAGAGTVTGSTSSGINCPASSCQALFTDGSTVSLTAHRASGHSFTGWTGGICIGTDPHCIFTIHGDTTVGASFN